MKKTFLLSILLSFSVILPAQNEIKYTSSNLNLRKNPWIDNNVICVIPKSTLIEINSSNQNFNEWVKVNYNGNTGYVYSKYIVSPEFKSTFNNRNDHSQTHSVKYYINSKGEKVQSPTYYNSTPSGATAECRDGTYSFSRSRRGTCSHHGGVKRWLY